ncbi:hypothetical protein BLNAU_23710 [Blattamonas nauphoetae]|uniref:Uncharacterized protein n=1 Tax=Blattamonas nauphoetae TaxID=2049346 RepID=A0ABQ9WPG1_9EUKA|nr:hypothetical protein BLNAU_23710 [Blattamonas nauphoetae]
MLIPHSDIIRRRRGDRSPICVCPHRHQRMFIRQLSVHRPKPKRGSCVCVYYTDGQASVSILSCFFSNCTADDHGGTLRLYFGHTQTVSNCVFLSFGNDASYGGIIYCENQKTEVHVSHNFFSDGNGSFGGAVLLKRPKGPASISFCVFRNCHGSFGCSCHVDDTSNSVSISHCDFLECTGSYGGGLYFDDCSSLVTVTDSSFEKCNASTGGAIFINNTASFKLDSLQFASCTSNKGKDVCFFTQSKADVDGTDMIVNCTSSSGNNNVYFGGDNSNDSDLIPQAPAVSLTPISVSASLTLEGDEWVLTVSTSEPIEGTLLVVLDNKPAEESNYEQPTSRSPPPIGRLFVLDFGSGETSKSQSVPINEWSFLQYESNYSITVASLAGANITQSFSSILVTPNPSRIVEATCEIKDGDPTTGIISLRGRTLEEGHYMAQLKEVGDLPISVTFTESHTLPNSKTMISSTIEVSLLGEEMKLEYGKEYEVEFVRKDGADSFMLFDPPRLFMLVPDPTRLTGAGTGEYRNDKDPSIVSIPLTGTEIPIGSYEMNVSLVEDGSSEEITLNVTFSSKESGTATAVVFDAENGEVDLLFDSEYSIVSLWNEKGSVWIPSPLSFLVPSPPIVESVESATLDGNKSSLVVILFGSGLVRGPDTAILFDGSTEISSKNSISVPDSTHARVTFAAEWTTSPSTVAYGQSYSLKSVSSKYSKSFLVRPSVIVNVPKAPCVTEISCVINDSLTHFVVKFTGQNLPLSGTYTARLTIPFNFSVTFKDGVGTSGLIEGNGTNGLSFGRLYTLSNVSYGSDTIILNKTSFSTPAGPTLSDVMCSLDSSDFAFVDLTLTGSEMPSSTEYKLIIVEAGKYTQMIVPVSFNSQTDGKGRVEVYNKANTLKYGQSYSVNSLIFGSLSIYPSPSITFDVPNPPRLTAVDKPIVIHNDGQSTLSIALTGTEIPVGSYEMNVSLVEDGSSEEITLNVSFSSKESGTATAVVFDAENGKVDLLFDSEYSIVSLWNEKGSVWIPSHLSFFVPSNPGIVETVDSTSLNDAKMIVTLAFCGSDFVSGPTHIVLLDGSNEVTSFGNMSVISSTRFTVSVAAGWTQSPSTVAYGQTYSLKSVSSSSSSFLVQPSISVKIPKAPCVTEINCDIDTSLTHFVVKFTGQDLPLSGTYTARLMSSSTSFEVTLSERVGKNGLIEGNATNGLLFGTEYTLSSLSQGTDQILLNATSFSTPTGPTLSDVTCSLDSSDFNFVDLTLSGSGMPSSTEYKLIVADSEDSTQLALDVSFTSSSEGSGSVEVYHKEHTLKYGLTYSVVSLTLHSLSISLPSQSITFDVPNPPRLTAVDEPILVHNDGQSTISIALTGTEIPIGSYEMNVSLVEDGSSEEITLNVSFSSKESGTATAVVFDAENGKVDLLFDSEYSIDSLWKIDASIWIPSSLSFVVPSSPGIVESIDSALLNDAKTIVTLTFYGSDFVSGPTHVVLLDGSNEVMSNEDLYVRNEIHFTVTFAAGWTQSPSTVAYDQTYSLKSVSSSSSSFIVRPSISVTIPKAPCVTRIECDIDTSLVHFVVKLSGSGLPRWGTCTARLAESLFSFSVTFTNEVGWSDPIEGNASNGLLFGTEYTLSSLSQGTDQILLNATSFSTPTGPTLSDVTCSLDSSDFNFVDLTLSGSGMPSSTEYKLIVADSEDSTQLALDVSFTSSSEGSGSVEVYHKEHTLKYGLTYSVVSLTLHSLSISLPSQSITFDVPNPPRLTAVDEPILVHNDGQSTLSIALTGTEIPVGSYEMNVSLVEDGSSEEITLNVSFSSKESGTATAVVFDAENGKVDLLFDSEYSIVSLWNEKGSVWIPSHLSFFVPSNPGIVETVDSTSLNDAKMIVTLAFCGSDFVSGPTHIVLLDGSNEVTSFGNMSVISSTRFTVSVAAGWTQSPSTVAYGQTYSLKSVSSSSSSFLVQPSISVKIPKAPCVTEINCDIDTSLTHFVVNDTLGTCWENGLIEGNATNGLLFGTEYTLSSLSQGTDQILLNATSFSTPTGPTLSDVTCSLDSSDFNFVDLTLSGSGMPSSTEYKLIVADSEDSTQLALDVSFTSSSEGSGSVEVYHKEHTLKYGLTYSVVSLTLHSLSISLPSQSITFDVPNPPRLTAVDEPILVHNDGQSTISIALTGTEIPIGSYEMNVSLVEDGSSEEITLNVSFSSKEWDSNSSLKIPKAPCVTGIICDIDACLTHFVVKFTGQDLPLSGTYTARLMSSSASFEVTFLEGVGTSDPIEVNATNGLSFLTSYTLSSVTSDTDHLLLNATSFLTPAGPTLSDVTCSLDSSDFNFVDLTLTGSGMPSSTEYELIVADSEDSTQLTLDVSFTTPSEGSGKVEVYHKENTLKYERSYSVVSLFLGSLSISIPDSVTFSTPSAPIRIEGATADLLDDGTTVMITLLGVKLGKDLG